MKKNLAVLSVVVMSVIMGGCASTHPPKVAEVDRMGAGEVFAVVLYLSNPSVESICKNSQGDDRCRNPDGYYGKSATVSATNWVTNEFPVLIPKAVEVGGNDIIKVRLVDGMAARFEFVANRGNKSPDCHYAGPLGIGTWGKGGVICPKYGFDYRDHVPNL